LFQGGKTLGRIAIIDGQAGTGKTTLIERLLESNKSRSIQVSRCLAKSGSGEWKEVYAGASGKAPSRHPELKKWLDAGAVYANLLTYDPDIIDVESLLEQSNDGFGDWDEWIVEAENVSSPRAYCSVYVLRPLPKSAELVETTEKIVSHIPLDEYLRLTAGEPGPDMAAEPDEGLIDEEEDVEVEDFPLDPSGLSESLAKAGVELSEPEIDRLKAVLQDGVPVRAKMPELRPECARLIAAEVVVINLHDENDRADAETTRSKVIDLFRDWNLRFQLSFRSQVTRPGVYIANLQDAGDGGMQKALAQIKRKLRGR
jgi:GTPase SAR1 family protein